MKRLGLARALVLCLVVALTLGVAGCAGMTTTTTTGATNTTVATSTTASTNPPVAAAAGTWTEVDPAGARPPARSFLSMVLDPTSGKALVFGGGTDTTYYNDTWAYDPVANAWTDLEPAGDAPSPREFSPMVYDPASHKVFLFGGWDEPEDRDLGDTWAYDPEANTWTELDPEGEVPSARDGHCMVYDPGSGQAILFGGSDNAGVELNDTWAYDPTANNWTELTPAGALPPARAWHSMVYDSRDRKVIIFGGAYGEEVDGTYLNDTWAYDPAVNSWTELRPPGDLPAKRSLQAMVYDSAAGQVLLFGGGTGSASYKDVWAYDLSADTWTEIDPSGRVPSARLGPSMVYDPDSGWVILFGGVDTREGQAVSETWVYDPGSAAPGVTGPAEGQPSGRAYHSMVFDPISGKVVLFGGGVYYPEDEVQGTDFDDTWAYDPRVNTWAELHPAGDLPPARSGNTMVYDSRGGKVILFGGATLDSGFNDTWAYDPEANTWTEFDLEGEVPSARDGHSMAYDSRDGEVILFGGWDGLAFLNDTWAYDPDANTWTELDPRGELPPARSNHAMVYDSDGGQVLLHGGSAEDAQFNDTWAYDPRANTWTELDPAGDMPSPRAFSAMVYDPTTGRAILFGGWDYEDYLDVNDTWAYDPEADTWTELHPAGGLPAAREGHSLVCDPTGGRLFLFGGWGANGLYLNDTWAYDPSRNKWTGLSTGTGEAVQACSGSRPFCTVASKGSRP